MHVRVLLFVLLFSLDSAAEASTSDDELVCISNTGSHFIVSRMKG